MEIPQEFIEMTKRQKLPAYRFYESVGSTNSDGLAWLSTDAPDGAIVFANHQSAGRGRSERRWVTNPESSIAVSIVLRLSEPERQNLQLFSALAGLALTLTLRQEYQIPAVIKWPNDVLIERQKTAGILCEATWEGDHLLGIVVGVGINILPSALPPAELLQFPATCVQSYSPKKVNRFSLLGSFLQQFFTWRAEIGRPAFLNQWEKLLAFRDETVYIKENDEVIFRGILSGIESNGDLRLISKEGMIKTFTVGDVHLRPEKS
jgi:BirA family biotin operon repressor/biotin-[acetyl-CoA-carboxylase] ligase